MGIHRHGSVGIRARIARYATHSCATFGDFFVFCGSFLFAEEVAGKAAGDAPTLPPEAQAVVDRFVAEGAKQVTDAEAKRTANRSKLDTALDAVQTAEGKAGRLESAVAVKKLRAELSAGKVPDVAKPSEGQPKTVLRAVESYQTDLAKIDKEFTAKMTILRDQAIRDLEVVKIVQTKGGHLDVALAVKQTQEQLRGGQPVARQAFSVLVIGKGGRIDPADEALLRRGGSDSTIEAVVTAIASDGMIFRCGGSGNGQSMAIMGDELWYAVAGARNQSVIKAPLNGAKPPLHLAITFAKGDVIVWINGVPAKREKVDLDSIGNNGASGGVGDVGDNSNNQAMPRAGFTGELVTFRYVDRVLYAAPFKVAFPLVASDAIRWQIDVQAVAVGPLKELPKSRIVGDLSIKR